MGSFYATCSITRYTICDGQPMYMQFMLPVGYISREPGIAELFRDQFLALVKEKGLEEATKVYDEITASWGKGKELSPKGLDVSNGSAYSHWVPFGPAIRGYYDDYGNIKVASDEDSQARMKILEGLMGGLPFDTIMEVAQDDRWFSLGMEDPHWRPEGISKDMPEWQLKICQKLSLTYFHQSVYDELSNFDFSAEEKNGVMKSKYSIKWKKEALKEFKKKLQKQLQSLREFSSEKDLSALEKLERKWAEREGLQTGLFRYMDPEMALIYQACLAREGGSLDWLYESFNFMYSLSGMCLRLRRSEYGSQNLNFFGWVRIYSALQGEINAIMEEYEEDEEE